MERLWSRVNRSGPVVSPELGPCHVWTGATAYGYGRIKYDGRMEGVHRVAYRLVHGRWPTPMALHRCDVRTCTKVLGDDLGPAHVYEGTRAENAADMVGRGRVANGERNGHARLTRSIILQIRSDTRPHAAVAADFGIAGHTVYCIRTGKRWAHVT